MHNNQVDKIVQEAGTIEAIKAKIAQYQEQRARNVNQIVMIDGALAAMTEILVSAETFREEQVDDEVDNS